MFTFQNRIRLFSKPPLILPNKGLFRQNRFNHVSVQCRVRDERRDLDPDFVEALDEVSSKTRSVILEYDENAAESLFDELTSTKTYLFEENDAESANYISVLQVTRNESRFEALVLI